MTISEYAFDELVAALVAGNPHQQAERDRVVELLAIAGIMPKRSPQITGLPSLSAETYEELRIHRKCTNHCGKILFPVGK